MASGSHRSGSNPSSSIGTWWDVVEILEEDGKRYKIRWAGKDPKTGKPWPLEWVSNSHCSPDLVRDWEKKKAKAKKQRPLASTSVSKPLASKSSASKSPVAFKRPRTVENRDAASTSELTVPTTRKRKHTSSASLDNAGEDSTPSRRKRLAVPVKSTPSDGHGGQSTAPALALPNLKDRPTTTEDFLSRPPLEEVEMWVPTPNAKFGPPKRKRTTRKRRDPPKEGPVDIAVPAKTPVPTPIPPPSLSRPLSLVERLHEEAKKEKSQSQPTSNQPGGTINDSAMSVPAKTPVPTPIPLLSFSRPLSLVERLHEEAKTMKSQSQPTSNQPGETINDSATSDPLPPTMRDTKGTTNVSKPDSLGSLERPMGQPSAQIQTTNPNVNNGRDLGPSSEGVTDDSPGHRFNPPLPSPTPWFNPKPSASANSSSKSPQVEKSMQGEGANTEDPHRFESRMPVFNFKPSASANSSSKFSQVEKPMQGEGVNTEDTHRSEPRMPVFNFKPSANANSSSKLPQVEKSMQVEGVNTKDTHRFEPPIPVFNFNPSTNAISSLKPPHTEKSVKTGPPRIGNPGTSPIKQHSPSSGELTGNGTLAKRRAFEALLRLDELRRAGKSFGTITAKGHPTLETSRSSEQPPPHVVFKRVMDGIESPNGSQAIHLGHSANEISASASSGENRKADALKSQEGLVIIKPSQAANMGSLSRTDGVPAANAHVPSSEDEVPPTASDSTQSQSRDALPHASLDSHFAAALDLLHKKSEEISELRIQINMLSTELAGNGALHGKEATNLATGVQTDRDNEAYKDWNMERTRWAEEKLALQGEAEALRGEKARALADVDFFRAQYQKASDFASSMRLENEELSARAALAESQATKGVALVRAIFDGRVARLEAEVQRYKALSEMLTERARLTDDDVRYRAALAPELKREIRQLGERFIDLEAELEDKKDELFDEKRANSKLRRQVARLESKEQAADVGQPTEREQDHVLWSDEKDDEDYNPTSSPRGGGDGSLPQPLRQEVHSPHNEDDAGLANGEIVQLNSIGLGESAQSSKDDMVYLCRWRSVEQAWDCDAVVSTKEELHEHVLSHHLACH